MKNSRYFLLNLFRKGMNYIILGCICNQINGNLFIKFFRNRDEYILFIFFILYIINLYMLISYIFKRLVRKYLIRNDFFDFVLMFSYMWKDIGI